MQSFLGLNGTPRDSHIAKMPWGLPDSKNDENAHVRHWWQNSDPEHAVVEHQWKGDSKLKSQGDQFES